MSRFTRHHARAGSFGAALLLATGSAATSVFTPVAAFASSDTPARISNDQSSQPQGGAYKTRSFDYDRGSVFVPQIKQNNAIRGHVVEPVGAPGNRPVIVFLHGFYDTCTNAAKETVTGWPCPKGSRELPSFRGYDYVQKALAAQGYYTVSVDANAVSGNDQDLNDKGAAARSVVLRANLRLLAKAASSPGQVSWPGKTSFDLKKLMLIGHSRGGEGVNRTALDSTANDPWRVAGIFTLAPTSFGRIGTPTIPSVTILPTCDGDVIDLAGQVYTDTPARYGPGAAFQSSLILTGGVHNFFNTEWTPGLSTGKGEDDGSRRACTAKTRISAKQQRDVLVTYSSEVARAFLLGDRNAQHVLEGRKPAKGAGANFVTAVPLGGNRTSLMNALGATSVKQLSSKPTGRAAWCTGEKCRTSDDQEVSPHWLARDSRDGFALRMGLAQGQSGGVQFGSPIALQRGDSFEARIVVRGEKGAHMKATLLDAQGKELHTAPIDLARLGAKEPTNQGSHIRDLAQLWRVDIPAGLEGKTLAGVRFTAAAASDVAVLDMSLARGQGGMTATPPPAVIDAPTKPIRVNEGSKRHTINVTLPIHGKVTAPAQVGIVTDAAGKAGEEGRSKVTWVQVKPGQQSVNLPFTVEGNTVDDEMIGKEINIETRGPLVVRNPTGVVEVVDDDPEPTFTITPEQATAKAGGVLEWKVKANGQTNRDLTVIVKPQSAGGNEILTKELSEATRKAFHIEKADETPFSKAVQSLDVKFDKKTKTATIRIATIPGVSGRQVKLALSMMQFDMSDKVVTGRIG
ncbi:hypothetical protein [Dermatophilus congolensis]|uniref:hypothetical protein n=1 Tax=Dermatophilus congolensis TaxID=1863 RepID=UPI001AAFE442|nr:hypothetical protein [Dermatophilus congolensis]MBO3142116.1 hypothetical protein [Dermatophilus congolensis]MBO3151108.1 hypothetical protein [Dermatophilus congolensis]MBO3161890.1 hypothetical protein [Dermatophilus congolensis]MBO3162391.1 hypothetical protein [Dermatophilus congolensis]MBO3175949.1 hypothetical protein [Dermatophilus congolensis]